MWDPAIVERGRVAPRRLALLQGALASLDRAFRERGGRLVIRRGDPAAEIAALAAETGATEVHAHRDYTPFARARFARVAAIPGVRLVLHAGTLLVEPEAIGESRVFSAFHRRWIEVDLRVAQDAPRRIAVPAGFSGEAVPASTVDPQADAEGRLRAFASEAGLRYGADRDRLDLDGTSHLSAALHLGLISPRRVAAAVDNEAFRRQLAWRDWASHLPWFRPATLQEGWDTAFRDAAWRDDADALAAWHEGRTGYPTVDAAMRQLAAEGWIHNRARMIVASFLAKDLLLDWRAGEAWFLRHLVDGDVANNSLGWQWTAGVGTDAAPYVRVLNPSLQGERFDPKGEWVRRWVPELRDVDARWIHRPWEAPDGAPARDGYPAPLVDHSEARRRALALHAAVGAARRARLASR